MKETDYYELTKGDFDKIMHLLNTISLQASPKKMWYSVAETQIILNVSKRTLQTWRDRNIITYSQIDGKIYFSEKNINEFMERHKVLAK